MVAVRASSYNVILHRHYRQYLLIQDPKEADPILRVQSDLDDTKIVLVCGCILYPPISHYIISSHIEES